MLFKLIIVMQFAAFSVDIIFAAGIVRRALEKKAQGFTGFPVN